MTISKQAPSNGPSDRRTTDCTRVVTMMSWLVGIGKRRFKERRPTWKDFCWSWAMVSQMWCQGQEEQKEKKDKFIFDKEKVCFKYPSPKKIQDNQENKREGPWCPYLVGTCSTPIFTLAQRGWSYQRWIGLLLWPWWTHWMEMVGNTGKTAYLENSN